MSVKRYSGTGAALNANPISFNITDQYRDDLPMTITIQSTGTWNATVSFEGTVDGINWYSLVGYDPSNNGGALTNTITGPGQVRSIPLIGVQFRARISSYTSGTVTLEGLTTYNDNTPWPTGLAGSTAGVVFTGNTQSRLSSAASTNATLVKNSTGNLYAVTITNTSAAVKYVKWYNKSSAPVVGTDTPVLTFAVPATSTLNFAWPVSWRFSNGIGFGITGAAVDTDATAVAAGDILLSYDWA